MQALDLATAGFISEHFQSILTQLQAMEQALPLAGADVPRLLSIEQVMAHCGVSRATVQRWLHKGKTGRRGTLITLQAYWFSPTQPSIPWPALAAFGQGLDFDLSTLNLGAKAAPEPAAPLKRRAA
ncbi:helix-turn-helix transcriptional regulator [Hymenobacter yonginensis]|uniref:Helix-turn-helix domain-containing protein n=1 Tax=Hymenobacter yonginensis TaxID=748197 RepID=A0ABY7PUG9_9BACT|nr:helix-turn-helix domain-containing protein [Hymenobacter yonginensis]WBO86270.1 helix-turn-helix domain-containing protein [Hymenobacter yonginensis]